MQLPSFMTLKKITKFQCSSFFICKMGMAIVPGTCPICLRLTLKELRIIKHSGEESAHGQTKITLYYYVIHGVFILHMLICRIVKIFQQYQIYSIYLHTYFKIIKYLMSIHYFILSFIKIYQALSQAKVNSKPCVCVILYVFVCWYKMKENRKLNKMCFCHQEAVLLLILIVLLLSVVSQ